MIKNSMMNKQKLQALQEPDYQNILQKHDFFPKIFLLPSEIKLHKDQGLKVVKRSPNHPDKFQQQKVLPISVDEQQIKSFKKFSNNTNSPGNVPEKKRRHPAGHGLLSLFKKTAKRRIKLAICICVYSQPKHMLKSTIKGIQQSYKHFIQKAGILPHQIILTVIFDGIQKVNASKDQTQNMISFFNEIDIKNGFVYKPYGKSLEQYLKQIQEKKFNLNKFQLQIDNQRGQDISLFTQEELSTIKRSLFQNQYNEYMRIKVLLQDIKKLKKQKNIRIQSLPHDINKKYEELCLNFCIENNMYYQTQEQIQEYLSTKKNIRVKLLYEAINQTQLLCKRYIESRQDKAILYPVRLESSDLRNPRDIEQQQQSLKDKKTDVKKQYNYMFFVVKHKNEGKLSSHMLFFQGFCKLFDPQYCMLTDVGIKPHKDAIYRMWAHMQQKPKCGGVCGYMGLQLQNPSDDLGYREDGFDQENLDCLTRFTDHFVSVQRAQQFEYHFAHMLDKPFQAAFGYIHVLPGAFSGYRWKALKSVPYKAKQYPDRNDDYNQFETDRDLTVIEDMDEDQDQQTIMKRYLKTATTDQAQISMQDSNMYLAEDRIMCLGIHALGYDLDYLPDAESTVDPVTSLTRLLGQRRRWINGSWFAFNYVRQHSFQRSNCKFLIQLYYYSFVQKIAWIGPALFYIAMNLTLISAVRQYIVPLFKAFFNAKNDYDLYNYNVSLFNVKNVVYSIPDIINFLYIILIFSVILFSLLVNNNNQKFKRIYYLASSLLGVYGIAVLVLLVYNSYEIISDTIYSRVKQDFIIPILYLRILIIFILVGHALPIIWTFSCKKYVQMIVSLLSYLFYTPTYVNILQIFAFCRIDDLSWGTKGLDADGNGNNNFSQIAKEWQRRKYIFVLQYVTTNVLVSYICVKASEMNLPRNIIILSSACLTAFLLLFRLIPAGLYLLKYNFRKLCGRKFSAQYINNNLQNGMRIGNALRVIQLKIKQIEKPEVNKKKKAEFKKMADVTQQILSKSLSGFGNKLRSKVAQHMVNNNVIPKKQIMDQKNKLKRKITLRKNMSMKKKLKTVEQVSNQDSEQSTANIKNTKPYRDNFKNEVIKELDQENVNQNGLANLKKNQNTKKNSNGFNSANMLGRINQRLAKKNSGATGGNNPSTPTTSPNLPTATAATTMGSSSPTIPAKTPTQTSPLDLSSSNNITINNTSIASNINSTGQINYDIVIPNKKTDIKARLEALRKRKSNQSG